MRRRDVERIKERTHLLKVIVFFAVLAIGAIVALILPLRPTKSELEKRDLTKFPEFSLASFVGGEYLTGIDVWYSDTFPFREQLLGMNSFVQSLKGIGTVQIHGNVQAGDDIPVDTEGKIASLDDEPSSEAPSSEQPTEPSNTEAPPVDDNPNVPTQTLGPVFVAGDSAYEFYRFGQSVSEKYSAVINYAADMLDGKATVYDIIVPNSMGVMLSDKIKENINTSDQKEAINYMFSVMNSKVHKVNIYDELRAHRNEYIYFRTDHHWTQLGAYYAYTQFCKDKGITPKSIDSYEKIAFDGFLGSFYADSGQAPALGNNPDTVYGYYPKATNNMTYYDKNDNAVKWNVIYDVSGWKPATKYSAFIGGDNPWAQITNPELNDGSACVVIKESYGNAFVPFLVDHYQNVYVIDYRYFKGKLSNFVAEHGIQDVIYINNIMATGTNLRIDDLIRITKQ